MKGALLALSGLLTALLLPTVASDDSTGWKPPQQVDSGESGAVQPKGRCSPQFIIRVPDFPEAEHVSASNVSVTFSNARICADNPPPSPTLVDDGTI